MKIGLIQLTSVLDYKRNLETLRSFMLQAKKDHVEAVFLPECFYSLSDGKTLTPYLVEKDGEHYENIRSLAKEFGVFLLGGSAATKERTTIVNRAYNFDPSGRDLGHYDKMHLFSCSLKQESLHLDERHMYTPGKSSTLINAGPLNLGLGICFDLRYPKMSWNYSRQGANILTFASAFTAATGKAHWHTLLKARAIENQCFIVAAAQWGTHNHRIKTFGHSLVVGPWGEVLADAFEGEKLLVCSINLNRVDEVKKQINI